MLFVDIIGFLVLVVVGFGYFLVICNVELDFFDIRRVVVLLWGWNWS